MFLCKKYQPARLPLSSHNGAPTYSKNTFSPTPIKIIIIGTICLAASYHTQHKEIERKARVKLEAASHFANFEMRTKQTIYCYGSVFSRYNIL